MKFVCSIFILIGIISCNKNLDPISYLVCEQDYQKADKIYVMTDTDKNFVMVQFGNAFIDKWELYDIATDREETKDLSTTHPDVAKDLQKQWMAYANRANVFPLNPRQARVKIENEKAGK